MVGPGGEQIVIGLILSRLRISLRRVNLFEGGRPRTGESWGDSRALIVDSGRSPQYSLMAVSYRLCRTEWVYLGRP